MCRSSYLLVSLVFLIVCGVAAGASDPDLVGWWWFDEGSGTVAADSSEYGNHGTLMNGAGWAPGYFRTALNLDGEDDYVEVPDNATLQADGDVTVMAWVNTPVWETPGQGYQGIIAKGNSVRSYSLYTTSSGVMHFSTGEPFIGSTSSATVPRDEWAHVCAMIRDNGHAYYLNGEEAGTGGSGAVGPGDRDTDPVLIGRTAEGTTRSFTGLIDDARIYMRGLTQEEIQYIMTGKDLTTTAASNPVPAEDQTDVQLDVVLSWLAGESAATHDVYLGTNLDDVNNASRDNPSGLLVSQGQTGTTYDPEGLLDIGQTYYWRVDEVNAAPDYGIFKGAVWAFTSEPLAYPVANITVTTNATYGADTGPEKTIDGSGLNADDQHSINSADMFQGESADGEPIWLLYEFDGVYKLHEALVWNYNQQFELLLGFGVQNMTVEYTTDGSEWISLGDIEVAQATAKTDYTANTTVDFGGAAVQAVRLTLNSNRSGMASIGLSELRFLYIPAQAREPQPADGATDVAVDTSLVWRGGRDAVSHEISFSGDEQAVIDGTTSVATVDQSSYTPGDLDLGATYYWKVTEIQDAESWESAVWSFSTQEYLVVDDFESYNNEDNVIYDSWIDGWVNETGSTVGHLTEPFAERTIVNSGSQSMPLFYDNVGVDTAEADFDLNQDWTAHGIQSLSLYFYGDAANSGGQLFVRINNTKIDYDGPAVNLTRPSWQLWNIDLSAAGNVSNVQSLTIGIEGRGEGGVVYIDDIRLYPEVPADVLPDITGAGDIVQGVPNDGVTTGGNDNGWPAAEYPDLAIDDDTSTKFLHFKGNVEPTGFQVTPLVGATIVTGLTFTTANDAAERDPTSFELYGSNDSIDGPYTLIASGDIVDFAGETAWERYTKTTTPIAFDNDVAYTHYQVMFPTVRDAGSANSMQIGEVELLGTVAD